MANPVPFILWLILSVASYFVAQPGQTPGSWLLFLGLLFLSLLIASSVRVAAQWEKVLVFRLGKIQGVKGPGLFTILPFFDTTRRVDTRIRAVDIPAQHAITKDNVPLSINGVIFFRVSDPAAAVVRVQDYMSTINQYAQTALRDVIGMATLDEILADRAALGTKVESIIESEISGWGIEVAGIRLQDLNLPEDLKRVMAREASAEREKRANITKSEGDRAAAENLAVAAETMARAPGALQLRTLQSLDILGASNANTIVMAVPVEIMTGTQATAAVAQAVAESTKKTKAKSTDDVPLADSLTTVSVPTSVVETITENLKA